MGNPLPPSHTAKLLHIWRPLTLTTVLHILEIHELHAVEASAFRIGWSRLGMCYGEKCTRRVYNRSHGAGF